MIQKVNLRLVNCLFGNHQTQKFVILKIPKRFQKRMKITFNRTMQQALQLQLKLLGIFWTLIKTILEGDLAATLSEKLLGHLLKHIVVLSKNRFAVHGIYSLMKVCCAIYKDVLKKKLEKFYKQTFGACRYMN